MANEVIKVFVGCDRSQLIAFKALEHSIKRNTKHNVECVMIDNSMMPVCQSTANQPYTNFSFARFGIPSFTGYQGRAIYLDADMLAMEDIAELWAMAFNGAKILLLEQPNDEIRQKQSKRRKQTAVMMLDCSRLNEWVPEKIIGDLGKVYDRTALMSLEIMSENEINESIPALWNCMDWYESGRSNLVHYTKIETQPWVYPLHKFGDLWMKEIKLMLAAGEINEEFIRGEVALGFVRPSLLAELGFENSPMPLVEIDKAKNYQMHKEMLLRHAQMKKKGLFGFLRHFIS